MRQWTLVKLVFAIGGLLIATPGLVLAADCRDPLGRLVSLEGRVEIQAAGSSDWRLAKADQPLCAEDTVRVGDRSRAAAELNNDNKLRLDQNTTLRLILPPQAGHSWLDLLTGGAYFFSRKPQSLDVRTPVVNAAVEGTEFLVRITAGETLLGVVHGRIRAANDRGEIVLSDGEAAVTTAATAPTSTLLVRPLDAVMWAIYYPSILPFVYDPGAKAPATLPTDLQAAINAASAGKTQEAFARFAAIPEAGRDADFYLYRASLLLRVGRADEAGLDLEALLRSDPTNATAYGLRAVIALAQNNTAQGVADANHAIELDPGSAPALIALSYAEQAQFRIDAAREAAERATTVAPENALAWARLAELWLMQGWRDRSRQAAEQAQALAPGLERVHTVAGFAALAEFDTARAQDAFERAIAISPGNPQPRLGLGLARIRAGSLREGRSDLELAVLLDPSNALLRSYLGKAYFEEKRNPLASSQFELAKELDPNDPTAFFYSAIQKQTENRPVEALRDLEHSIDLNDDRAIYRSRELLDSDRAARGASLGRIYDDLGFQQLGVNAATQSLSFDPSNAAAHRFLSDIYVAEPRRDIARLSELLQAQLLQDVNINPVQPSLSVTGFNVVTTGGPARPGFNEFNPLFERNQVQLNATGLAGNQGTWGNETVVSGLYNQYSVSAGQFHYQTEGFRDNNDVHSNIYNFYAQAAVTPDFNVQGEFNGIKSKTGDLIFSFDPDFHFATEESLTQYNGRVGARYSLNPNLTLLSSFIYSNADYDTDDGESNLDLSVKLQGYQGENALLYRGRKYNIVGGFGAYHAHYDLDLFYPDLGFFEPTNDRYDIDQQLAYMYSDIRLLPHVLGTLGMSIDNYNERDINQFRVNPKLGVQWEVTPKITLRSAVFRTVKPPLITSRTIQPTQVSGFNQFFDDPAGTEAWRYGVGMDVRFMDDLSGGLEVSKRNVQINQQENFSDAPDTKEQRHEDMGRAYLYWTPDDRWAVSSEFVYDLFDREDDIAQLPSRVETISTPLSLRYFHPSGFFATMTWTYVHQDVNQAGAYPEFEGTSNFNLLDAAIGYRLPNRWGIMSLQGTNLLDTDFRYQDDSYREVTRTLEVSRFVPKRGVIARITLNY